LSANYINLLKVLFNLIYSSAKDERVYI